ncbi:MAG: ATP-binding protein [Spirochaetales bacterium]
MDYIYDYKKLNTLTTFLKGVKKQKLSHAYLFLSSDKNTNEAAAILFASSLVCAHKDAPCFECSTCLKVINRTGVDVFTYPKKNSIVVEDIKDIIENAATKPLEFSKKIFVLNNIDEATISAQNKLLKTLEEPEQDVIFILTATSIKAVLPTIVSRARTILLPKSEVDEIEAILKEKESDANRIAFSAEVSEGSLGRALDILNDETYFSTYNFVLDMLINMKTTKDVINYSSVINKNTKFINLYLEQLEKVFRDVLMIKAGTSEVVFNKHSLNTLTKISEGYSQLALSKIVEKILEHKKMLKFNANPTGVIDTLLIGILEVKYKWREK